MKEIPSGTYKLHKLSSDQKKVLNHIVNMENRIIFGLKKLQNKNQISDKKHKDLNLVGSRPRILYGRAKIYNSIKDGVPPFHPILSDISTPTNKRAKSFVPLVARLKSNECTSKDLFSFSEELLIFDSNLVMGSFETESLFLNIPLNKTIDLCVNISISKTTNTDGITKDYFHELLSICISESLALFDGKFYKKIDATLANIIFCFHEQVWLDNCPV